MSFWKRHPETRPLERACLFLCNSHLALAGWLIWSDVFGNRFKRFRPNSCFGNTWLKPSVTETSSIATLSATFEAKLLERDNVHHRFVPPGPQLVHQVIQQTGVSMLKKSGS